MNSTAVFTPMLLLAGWTIVVLLIIPYRRFRAAHKKLVTSRDFALGESDRVPPHVALANRNYMNLLEIPVLFYVLVITLYVTDRVDSLTILLAWLYVVLRVCHSLVHLTWNKVLIRLICFTLSNVVLVILWVSALIRIVFL